MPDEEKLDVPLAVERLNEALSLQYRSALEYALLAGGLLGFEFQGLREPLAAAAGRELEDTQLLIEKITALDGEPTTVVASFNWDGDPRRAVDELIEHEEAAITALQAAIEPTGREGVSEALEHLLEHSILRKQQQVDLLLRARRSH
jgi:bacterioferritin